MDDCRHPECIASEEALEDLLAAPSPAVISLMKRLPGDIIILGVAGKMGMSLARQAANAVREAGVTKTVYGAARFTNPASRYELEAHGVTPVCCDLLDSESVSDLPAAPNVLYLAGRKFGTAGGEPLTWATNVMAPTHVASRYRGSRIVAFSTGCVYPLVDLAHGGCTEADAPDPVGEYAQSCLGRERVFEYASERWGTPVCLFRLNYAIEPRYGVLHDIAATIQRREPVSLAVPLFNAIWQGDANAAALLALEHCAAPAVPLNVTGPETASVRQVAAAIAGVMDAPVTFADDVGSVAYLNCAAPAHSMMGYPRVPMATVLRWTGHWVARGGRSLGKPTHFETNTGRF